MHAWYERVNNGKKKFQNVRNRTTHAPKLYTTMSLHKHSE